MAHKFLYPSILLNIQKLACKRGDNLLFQNLFLQAKNGDFVQINGANGIGKSSLLRLICELSHPEYGTIALSRIDQNSNVALHAPENMHLLAHKNGLKESLTVLENLAFWHHFALEKGVSPIEATGALAIAHLEDLPISVLSAGQKRRVAFARLLVERRVIWLLDEPTAALDTAGDELVCTLTGTHLKEGGIVLAATHLPLKIPRSIAKTKTIDLTNYAQTISK